MLKIKTRKKNTIYHTVETILKSNIKIVDRSKIHTLTRVLA